MAGAIVQDSLTLDDSGVGGTTIATTLNGVTAGNTLVAHCGGDNASVYTMSVSDGTSYSVGDAKRNSGSDQRSGQVFYKENSGSGSFTATCTFSIGGTINRRIRLYEVSGLQTSGSLDQSTGQYQASPGTGANGVSSGASAATTNANDFVMGFSQNITEASPGTGTMTAGTGYAIRGAGVIMSAESKSVSATSAQTATFTQSVNNERVTHVVAFKEAAVISSFLPLMGQGLT